MLIVADSSSPRVGIHDGGGGAGLVLGVTRAFSLGQSREVARTRCCPSSAGDRCPARCCARRPMRRATDGRALDFFGGFKLTFQHLTRPTVTTSYPKQAPQAARQHGRHVLNRYEDGMEKCIGCELCAGVCPVNCIYVRGLDTHRTTPVSRASATATSTRSTTYVAFTATSASRPARPRRSPSPRCSSFLHQPLRRDLHEGRTPRGRSGLPAAPAVGGLARG